MRILVTLVLVCLSSPAMGVVYTWKDSSGIVHYTNKEYEIPVRYRVKAKAIYPDPPTSSAPQPNAPPQTDQAAKPVEQPKAQQPVVAHPPPGTVPGGLPADRIRRPRRAVSSVE